MFENIFEKKENKRRKTENKRNPENLKIIADYREKNSLVIAEIRALENSKQKIQIEFQNLKIADFIVRDVAIERKTIFDFFSSIKNKRLIKQLEELQQYPKKLLIIEGNNEQELYDEQDFQKFNGFHPNAVRGMLLTISLKFQVPIILTKDEHDTACFLYLIAKKKAVEASLNVTKKSLNKKERKQFILEGFPGIGPKSAKKLLKKFKTIKAIFNASEEELKEMLGKKVLAFKNLIDEKY